MQSEDDLKNIAVSLLYAFKRSHLDKKVWTPYNHRGWEGMTGEEKEAWKSFALKAKHYIIENLKMSRN